NRERCKCTSSSFLKHFGKFPANDCLPFGFEILRKFLQSLCQAMRRFVQDNGSLFGGELLHGRLPALLQRQKTLKHKSVAGNAALHQSRHKCSSTWQTLYINPISDTLACK